MKREKINAKYKWTIDEMYPTESDFRVDVEKVKNQKKIYTKYYILRK